MSLLTFGVSSFVFLTSVRMKNFPGNLKSFCHALGRGNNIEKSMKLVLT